MGERLLDRIGCTCEAFDDPRDALRAFEKDVNRFDVVMTNLTMPYIKVAGSQACAEHAI
ncbi:MAG: hypothetical protein M2R45_03150 [Verrucomicrobia subdivision 3 bacterium]|nr:hypothetical protein [Limisphaerales bacterium]MCS1413218.1 hypothetical protein [Limisphaerales bacterium]